MKVYVFCDMEGISGVSAAAFLSGERADLVAFGRQRMAADINACVDGCFQADAREVVVRDGHGAGLNIHLGMIDPRAELVQGASPGARFPGLDGADAVILLGYHAMAGTADAVMEHTYSSVAYQNMWLNGRPVGEIGLDAAIAAEHGVPVVLVTGDDKACHEAEDWIPGVETCAVKIGLAREGARLFPLARVEKAITEATRRALQRRADIAPVTVAKPVVLRRELVERQCAPLDLDATRVDGRTYERSGDSVEKLLLFG